MTIHEYTERLSHYLTSLPDSDRVRLLDYYREYLADLCEDGMREEEAVATLPAPFALAAELMGNPEQEAHEGMGGQTEAPILAPVPDAQASEAQASDAQASGAQASDATASEAPASETPASGTPTAEGPVIGAQSASDRAQAQPQRNKGEFSALIVCLLILGFPLWFSVFLTVLVLVFSLLISLWAVILSLWAVVICFYALVMLVPGAIVAFVTDGVITGLLCLGAGLTFLGLALLSTLGMAFLTKYSARLTAWSMKRLFGWMIPKKWRKNA